ncbi:cytochrome P450 [Colletotrichum graminicola M1.001]|uniref:Cytochrome P450 n=1 Tax=Colletotrichum graminicola (strain M1.001 / M2 / FGSC 10212) TaxID=645133 RepID=E3Q7X7_COLGM|nr:cytochrome P450 [Colletotrichum graminicola M1.001]EFQ26989.1 cytochrome P450 [Colletotrichum graminicola M1.001]
MTTFDVFTYLAAVVGLGYLVLALPTLQQKWKLHSHRSQLPPGPKTIRTGINKPWIWFQELSKEYGDVVYLQMGPTSTIVLGSAQAAWDLLEKKGAIFSSRTRFITGGELLSGGKRGLMAPYPPFWRRWRKLLHSGSMQRQSETYRPVQSLESKVLIHELLAQPREFRKHLERYAASAIVTVTYGRRVEDVSTDIVVQRNAESMGRLTAVNIPGKFAVERYPVLKYVPSFLAPWKAEVLEQRQKDVQLYTELMDEVRAKVAQAWRRLALRGTSYRSRQVSSAGSLASFLLACAKFGPQFIPKAQEELDRVVGSGRLPDFTDLARLEDVEAIASEILRWRPVAVLGGTPHASTADHTYRGMFIPKGSTIIAPLWSIHLNEADFPEPHEFRPERFTERREYPGAFGHSAFGWGRRICPGMHLGSASVALNIARILWVFAVGPAEDEKGRDIDVEIFAYSDGFNSSPLPFPCSITPRSSHHAAVIQREHENALKELGKYTAAESMVS